MRNFFGIWWRRNGLVNEDIGLGWDISTRRDKWESGTL